MTNVHRAMICYSIDNNDGDTVGNIDTLYIVSGDNGTSVRNVKINAGVDTIVNPWTQTADLIESNQTLDHVWATIKTMQGGHFATVDPHWKVSLYSISDSNDSILQPNTGTVVEYYLDDVKYIDLGSNQILADLAIKAKLDEARLTDLRCHTYLCLSWDEPAGGLLPFAGEGTWQGAKFRFKYCSANQSLNMDLGDGVWYPMIISGQGSATITSFQDALDLLAAIYPTDAYKAGYYDDGSCQIIIVQEDEAGTPGTITYDQTLQDLIESSGTWLAPMRMGVDYSKWVS